MHAKSEELTDSDENFSKVGRGRRASLKTGQKGCTARRWFIKAMALV